MKPTLPLIALGIIGCAGFAVAQRAVSNDNSKADATVTTIVPAKPKPFRYCVAVQIREYIDGNSHEMTSFSLPIVTEDIPATIELRTDNITISTKATVTRPQQTAMAIVNVSVSRDGSIIGSPTLAVALGHNGHMHIGNDEDGLQVVMVLTRS
jgi:hypothetical protein